eukprot:403347654
MDQSHLHDQLKETQERHMLQKVKSTLESRFQIYRIWKTLNLKDMVFNFSQIGMAIVYTIKGNSVMMIGKSKWTKKWIWIKHYGQWGYLQGNIQESQERKFRNKLLSQWRYLLWTVEYW